MFTLRFPCGASMLVRHSPADHGKRDGHEWARDKKGRYRVAVYCGKKGRSDSMQRPVSGEGKPADCLRGCPCKRKAGRKETACMPDVYDKSKPMARQTYRLVTCHIEAIEGGAR